MFHQLQVGLRVATFAVATCGLSTAAAQTIAATDTIELRTAPPMVEAALIPARATDTPASTPRQANIVDTRVSSQAPGLMATILALAASAFWLTVVAHVLGRPSPPRRRAP